MAVASVVMVTADALSTAAVIGRVTGLEPFAGIVVASVHTTWTPVCAQSHPSYVPFGTVAPAGRVTSRCTGVGTGTVPEL